MEWIKCSRRPPPCNSIKYRPRCPKVKRISDNLMQAIRIPMHTKRVAYHRITVCTIIVVAASSGSYLLLTNLQIQLKTNTMYFSDLRQMHKQTLNLLQWSYFASHWRELGSWKSSMISIPSQINSKQLRELILKTTGESRPSPRIEITERYIMGYKIMQIMEMD
jgi:hypothetical protein